MKEIDGKTQKDIETLLNIARPKLIEADRGQGDCGRLFNEVSAEFGPLAHLVYLVLDTPERSCEQYHDKASRRVLLDPWTVINRSKAFKDSEITIDDFEFWEHADMIKTLCDYLDLRFNKEVSYACST